jgi:hypothetical protein
MKELRRRLFSAAALAAFAGFIGAAPAMGDVLFSDLGPAGNVYNPYVGWYLGPVGSQGQPSWLQADLFTVPGTGNVSVDQIDLAVYNVLGPNTFYASIWTTANIPIPGAQVPGAYWNLSTPYAGPDCCDLVSITGVTGVYLTGGQSYFLVLGPAGGSFGNFLEWNNQGVTGLHDYSVDGGATWQPEPSYAPLGAFDVLGSPTPEPDSFLVLGIGVVGIWGVRRSRSRQPIRD